MGAPVVTTQRKPHIVELKEIHEKSQVDDPELDRFQVIPIGERAFDPLEPIEWVIEGVCTKRSLNAIFADAGSGKTYCIIDMAVCKATGKHWLGFALKRGPVLIVDEESGEPRLTRRMQEGLRGHLVEREDNPPIYAICFAGFDARNLDHINRLIVAIIETGVELVIIDAFMEVVPGADENSVKDILPALIHLRRVAETTGAAIWLIHHSNKSGSYRGTSAIKGKVDNMLLVEREKGSKFVTFKSEKSRDTEPHHFTAEAHWIADPPQFYLTETNIDPKARRIDKTDRFVLRYLADNTDTSMSDLISATDATRTTIKQLENIGYLELTKPGGKGRGNKALYGLTQRGRDALLEVE